MSFDVVMLPPSEKEEKEHQVIKRIAEGSNYRNVSKRIVEFFCLQFGFVLGLRPEERATGG